MKTRLNNVTAEDIERLRPGRPNRVELALEIASGNRSRAADLLGVDIQTLARWLRQNPALAELASALGPQAVARETWEAIEQAAGNLKLAAEALGLSYIGLRNRLTAEQRAHAKQLREGSGIKARIVAALAMTHGNVTLTARIVDRTEAAVRYHVQSDPDIAAALEAARALGPLPKALAEISAGQPIDNKDHHNT